ncbi:hypothetical protein EOM86_13555, partial [Candidatus Nomurabacteria bacterium]|nr:hypothetical protein [Candidatus Nomurabacteria bacterium]
MALNAAFILRRSKWGNLLTGVIGISLPLSKVWGHKMNKKISPISEAESSYNVDYTISDPINARISLYQSTFDNTGKSTNIGAELERIRAGAVRPLIELLRSCDGSQYDELKKKLPMACFQGLMEPKRGKENLTMPSGVLCVDFDGFNTDEAISVRDNLKTCQHILAAWLSP